MIDKSKWLDSDEARQLRRFTETRSEMDVQAGRRQGVVDWMIVDLALSTGLRAGELALLDAADFKQRTKTLRVPRTKRKRGIVHEIIPVSDSLAKHLIVFGFWRGTSDGPILVSQARAGTSGGASGGRYTVRGLQHAWKRSVRQAGLDDCYTNIHTARHTACVEVLERCGGDLRVAQRLLGHADIQTTMKYVHLPYKTLAEGVSRMYAG